MVGRSFFVGLVVVGASETVGVGLVAVSTSVTVEKKKKGNVSKMKTVKLTYEDYLSILTIIRFESQGYFSEKKAKDINDALMQCKFDNNGVIKIQVEKECI